jgi:hypothetical protein
VVALDERRRLVGHLLRQVGGVVDVVQPDSPDQPRVPVRRAERHRGLRHEHRGVRALDGLDQVADTLLDEDGPDVAVEPRQQLRHAGDAPTGHDDGRNLGTGLANTGQTHADPLVTAAGIGTMAPRC